MQIRLCRLFVLFSLLQKHMNALRLKELEIKNRQVENELRLLMRESQEVKMEVDDGEDSLNEW